MHSLAVLLLIVEILLIVEGICTGHHHNGNHVQAVRVVRPWPTALVRVRQTAAHILRKGLRLRGGGTSGDNIRRRDDVPRDQGSCETDMRRSSGAEVAGPGLNDGEEMTASSEPMMENMSDLSDESLKDADLVFRDQEIQNEWLQFVEQGRSPTVKPRSQTSVKLKGDRCVMDKLLGTGELLGQKGAKTPVSALASKEVVGLYFSAHWCVLPVPLHTPPRYLYVGLRFAVPCENSRNICAEARTMPRDRTRCPPCRGFTPALATLYTSIVAKGKSFEIVFVSSDRDEGSFQSYFAEMPWLALPFADRQTKQALSDKFGVQVLLATPAPAPAFLLSTLLTPSGLLLTVGAGVRATLVWLFYRGNILLGRGERIL